ncbi:hypothetical protein QQ045_033132 [Rhodiola kirilowii]
MKTLAAVIACLVWTVVAPITEAASVDCSPFLLSLADCLTYVSEGSTIDKPEASCCSGLKDVLKASPDCLCVGFKSSAQFGVKLNLTKALALPSACHLSAPPTNCGLAPAPQATPPAHAPSSASAPIPEVSGPSPSNVSANVVAPASSPKKSGSAAITTVSLFTSAFSLFAASFIGI